MSFEEYVLEHYKLSVYQIELQIALGEFCRDATAEEAWDRAQEFMEAMRTQYKGISQ